MNRKLIIGLSGVVVACAIILVLICINRDNPKEKYNPEDIEITRITDWDSLTVLWQEEPFQLMGDDQKNNVLSEVLMNLKDKYGFESYEYNLKQNPLVITLHFSDGHIEAVQLGDFNPMEN